MVRKALIVYASVTGNTEKVAVRFKQVIEKTGRPWGDWECDTYKVTKRSDRKNPPYYAEDYDLFLVGAPIWSGIPPLYLYDDHLGSLIGILSPKGQNNPRRSVGWKPQKGIVFLTYGGTGQGPLETTSAFGVLEREGMERWGIKCVGKFACCGGHWDEPAADHVAAKFDWMVGDAAEAIARYKENPNNPEFAKLTEEERKLFSQAATDAKEFKTGGERGPATRAWHWDFKNRPNERDLLKAEIFLEEVLEDYYGGGIEMFPFGQYLCIA
jgi:flavodoxin